MPGRPRQPDVRPAPPPGDPFWGGPDQPLPGGQGDVDVPGRLGWWPVAGPDPVDDGRPVLLDLDAPEDLGPDPRRRRRGPGRDAARGAGRRSRPPARTDGRRTRIVLGTAVALLLGGGAWGAVTLTGAPGDHTPAAPPTPDPRAEALAAGTAFLAAWQKSDYAAMQRLVDDPKDVMARVYGGMTSRLGLTGVAVTPGRLDAGGTTLPFHAVLTLRDHGDLAYDSALQLASTPAGYRVHFTSDTVYPGLAVGQRLDLVDGDRAAGLPIEPGPSAPSAPPQAVTAPSPTTGTDIGTAAPTATVGASRGRLLDRHGASLEDDDDLQLNVLGRADSAGGSGLQRVLDDQLTGTAGVAVAVVDAVSGKPVRVLAYFPGKAADALRTTLDLKLQRAAEKAIAGFDGKAALVAIDAPTGEIRAIANNPVDGLPPALATRYAPGSTFKVVTATAALMHGSTPSSTVSCPDTITAGGTVFHNHERSPRTRLTLTEAFARSCNTAFIGLARDLPDGALAEAARLYGFGIDELLPISAVSGDLPEPRSPQEAAADAIGQGRVGASPLVMASVAAAVADGTWRQPHLTDCPRCETHRIPNAGSLRTMMRAVVTSGTGTAVAGVPGGPVRGKTGTAEYGTGDPPATHAWFIGWQGRTAFAVFVEDGSSGGAVAAPVAARFLRLIGGG